MLQARALRKQYGEVTALHGLELRVPAGELFCLLGANGAGKTTTIQLFLGFIEPTSGEALIDGLEVRKNPLTTKERVAYIPENVMLYPHLTGLENLTFFATLGGAEDLSAFALLALLKRAGLAESAAGRRVGTYSKGMRQKVGIAMALAKRAKVLLLDEPTSGLDPKAANEFSTLLRGLRDDGMAILMATHDIFRSKQDGDRVGIMKHGRLVATHAMSELSHADLERVYLEHMHD